MTRFPRTPPRLDRVFGHNPLYFVTCCSYRRRPVLANTVMHAGFSEFAERAYAESGVAVGRYVIMPDHLHLFVCGPDDFILGRWVGALKRVMQKRLAGPRSSDPFWQRGFFDHKLRNGESYSQKWNYVEENPVRAGLTKSLGDWPFSGEIVTILGR